MAVTDDSVKFDSALAVREYVFAGKTLEVRGLKRLAQMVGIDGMRRCPNFFIIRPVRAIMLPLVVRSE